MHRCYEDDRTDPTSQTSASQAVRFHAEERSSLVETLALSLVPRETVGHRCWSKTARRQSHVEVLVLAVQCQKMAKQPYCWTLRCQNHCPPNCYQPQHQIHRSLRKLFSSHQLIVTNVQQIQQILLLALSTLDRLLLLFLVFTARCTLVQSAVLQSHVICLSVCNVGGLSSHRLEFFENNFNIS